MRRFCSLLGLLIVLGLTLPATSGQPKLEGTWKLSIVSFDQMAETPEALLQFAKVNGELKVAVIDSRTKDAEVKSVKLKKGILTVVLKTGFQDKNEKEDTFECSLGKNLQLIKGSYGDEKSLTMATLTPTTEDKITKEMTVKYEVPLLDKVAGVNARVQEIRKKAVKSEDKEEKTRLINEWQAASKAALKEIAGLYREAAAKHSDSPAVVETILTLFRNKAQEKFTAKEAKRWVDVVNKWAAGYGKRFQLYIAAETAVLAQSQGELTPVVLEQATRAEKLLDANSSVALRVKVLSALEAALFRTGKTAEAKMVGDRAEQLNAVLDREYLAKVPPFKGTPFPGRQGTSDRVGVMELFTGAQCPPCVAADVAFDVLAKTYSAKDLVLIQYHMHIPGPDPLTNADTEARWKYYGQVHPNQVRGTPTALFNGKVFPGGGGGMAAAEAKYGQYCQAIEPLLQTPAGAKLAASANRAGDKINIEAAVSELKNPGDNVKLRLLLVEETVRYLGGNKLRLHHHVVRAFPGGVNGVSVKEQNFKHTASIDLQDLRKQLHAYLDDYAATKRPFPKADRPMRFDQLRVIALVQNDANGEILQATQVEIGGDKEGR